MDSQTAERRVMEDQKRSCLYGVAGPCFHPKCLEEQFKRVMESGEK